MFNKSGYHAFVFFIAALLFAECSGNKGNAVATGEDFCSQIHRNDSLSLSAALKPMESKMKAQTGVYVLEDGGGSMVARAWLSEYAEKSIDIQYFIFSTDNVGLIACDYLVRAANRGVKVRILVDDIMVEASGQEILTMDTHENIEIKIYNPGVNIGKNIFGKIKKYSTSFLSANQRMHNKIFTVDGKVTITGGRNIADEYFDYDHEYNFRDRDVLLLGKVNDTIHTSFESFWNHALSVPIGNLIEPADSTVYAANRFDKLHQYACNPENFWPQVREQIKALPQVFSSIQASNNFAWLDSVYFVSDIPGKNGGSKGMHGGGTSTDALTKLVNDSKTSLDIQSPYLIVTEEGLQLFKEAVARGVKVRILTNSMSSTDNMEAFSGYRRDRKKLLEAGIRIFEFRPDAAERYKIMTGSLQQAIDYKPVFGLHAKSMVVDGRITVIGTFNMDPRSANLNTECLAVIYSGKIADGVLLGMEEEFKPENSWETTVNFNPDHLASMAKRAKTASRRMIPKKIL